MQIALDLTCALVAAGSFRFATDEPGAQFDELARFVLNKATKINLKVTTK
jgi:hypothetical protein